MPSRWLDIPLEDYEGHMGAAGTRQLEALKELFQRALDWAHPESVAVLGVAGGNGLERIDSAITKRIVGIDINQEYLDRVRERFEDLAGLELYRADLAQRGLALAQVALVHAALIFEHAGLSPALDNALSLVSPAGAFSVVLQLPSVEEAGVAPTRYASIQALKHDFTLIDVGEFRRLAAEKGFELVDQQTRGVPNGKALWLGTFVRIVE